MRDNAQRAGNRPQISLRWIDEEEDAKQSLEETNNQTVVCQNTYQFDGKKHKKFLDTKYGFQKIFSLQADLDSQRNLL